MARSRSSNTATQAKLHIRYQRGNTAHGVAAAAAAGAVADACVHSHVSVCTPMTPSPQPSTKQSRLTGHVQSETASMVWARPSIAQPRRQLHLVACLAGHLCCLTLGNYCTTLTSQTNQTAPYSASAAKCTTDCGCHHAKRTNRVHKQSRHKFARTRRADAQAHHTHAHMHSCTLHS